MAKGTLADPNSGERIPYDPDFNGPLKNRSCTDVICLLIFMVFVGCWLGIGIYVFVNGDPDKLLIPRDSNRARCGYDFHVANKPYLFFFDLTKCISPSVPFTGCPTTQVCVERCPTENYLYGNSVDLTKMICVDGVKPTSSNVDELVSQNKCARWHLKSTQVLKRCVPSRDIAWSDIEGWDIPGVNQNDMSSSSNNINLLAKAEQVIYDIVQDIKHSWKEMLVGVVISIVFCIVYIFILRWIASIVVWLSILGCLAGLSFCVYWSAMKYKYYRANPYEYENANTALEGQFQKANTWLGILIAFSVVLGILFLLVVFLRKRIMLAIALIKEGSKAVSAVTSALFFPVVPWILQLGVIVYAIAVATFLSTVGSAVFEIRDFDASKCLCVNEASAYTANGVQCNPQIFNDHCSNKTGTDCEASCKFITMGNENFIPYLHAINIFGFFWGVFFISALCEMILAATFATWYWTFKKSNVPFFTVTVAALRTFRFHLGTLAFGSLIITICRIIRVILEYIDHKLKKYDNAFTKAILCCLKCFFWCLEKFLKFINKNAYIMCAIHGKNFCASAKDAFSLLLRNIVRVVVLDKITDFLFFLSKILVVVGVSCIVYAFVEYVSKTQLTYNYVPVVFVAICTYFLASMFFKVYTMAIDTLFLCFLEDAERNDGSAEKPYFMSKNLMKILNKKNK